MKQARWAAIVMFALVGQPVVFGGTAAAQSDACRVGQELDPGDYCTVNIPNVSVGTDRFEVRSDGTGCYGFICSGRSIDLNGFEASRITGTSRWRIDALPGGGGTNRPPRSTGSIPAQTLAVGGSAASVNVARYFTDPDGDALTYTARSSRTAVVTVSVSGPTVTLAPVSAGTATITVTASDLDGETAIQSISVTVQPGGDGDACRVGQELGPGDYCTVDIPGVNVGTNRFEVRSDGQGCYGSICSGQSLNLSGFRASRAAGTSRWRIDALPGGGGTNRPPRPTGSIPAQTLSVGDRAASLNVSRYFTDPDGDVLRYAARSSRTGIVRASASASTVTLTPVAAGTATVTVTASDPDGETATQSISVTVRAGGGANGFTDDPLVPGVTPVRAVHFRELRTRIDALRTGAGVSTYAWTDRALTPGVTRVRTVHLTELRAALNQAYDVAGQPRPTYTDAGVRAGTTPIRAAHVTELRAAVVELEKAPTGLMPDLVVGSPTVSDSTLTPGQSFTLSATVHNRGSARAAATTLRYYRSTDSRISTSDTSVGTDAVSALAAGASGGESISLTAPSSAGTYYYGACVDPVREESNNGNNCSSGVRVMVESGGGGQALTGEVTTCSGTRTVGTFVDVVIAGTVTARRAVSLLTLTGRVNSEFVGIQFIGSMSAGETENFRITGVISTSASTLRCTIHAEFRFSNAAAPETGESVSVSETGAVR